MKAILLLLLLWSIELSAQEPITFIRNGVYSQNGQTLKHRDLNFKLTEGSAYHYWQKARASKTANDIFGGIGGFGLGWAIGGAIFKPPNLTEAQEESRKNTNRTMLIIGGVSTAISIPFIVSYNKNAKLAIEEYNQSLGSAYRSPYELSVLADRNGFGLRLGF